MERESLKIDLCQLVTVAKRFCDNQHIQKVTYEASIQAPSPERRFFIMAGTEEIRNFLLNFKFSKSDIKVLKNIPELKRIFATTDFDQFLKDFRFMGDFWSVAEGEVVFAGEPLIRLTGSVTEVCLAKTFILSVLNYNVDIASKAARIILAARGKPVFDNVTKCIHHESAIDMARVSYLVGFAGTSNIEAHKRYGIPTYIGTQVINNMDEYKIDEMSRSGALIDCFIIDTDLAKNMVDITYDLVYNNDYDISFIQAHTNGITLPGKKQIFLDQRNKGWSHLLAIDESITPSEELIPLLDCYILNGKPICEPIRLNVARTYCNATLKSLHPNLASLMPGSMIAPVVPHESIQQLFAKAVRL